VTQGSPRRVQFLRAVRCRSIGANARARASVQARNESGRRTVTAGARVVSILRRLDLKAGIEQPLNDDICRMCSVG